MKTKLNKEQKKLRRQKGIIYASTFAISLAATFFISMGINKGKGSSHAAPRANEVIEVPMTAGEKLLNSLFNYVALDIDANINIKLENDVVLDFNLDGQGKISDIENIQLLANLDARIDGTPINGEFGYFQDTLTFSLEDVCYFKLETADLLDFIDMVPQYGVQIDLPEELTGLSIDTITNSINSISEENRMKTPSGDYYYNLSFGEGESAFNVMVLTDTEDSFKGLRIDTFYFNGTRFSLDAKLKELTEDEFTIVNPLLTPKADKYQNFKPIFNLVDAFYNLSKKEQLGVDLDFTFEKQQEDLSFKNRLNANVALDLDLANRAFGADFIINENERTHKLKAAYVDDTIYAKFHNVGVSIEKTTVADLITYTLRQLSEDTFDSLMADLSSSLSDIDIGGLTNQVKNAFKGLSISDTNLNLTIDLGEFGLEGVTPINLGIDYSDDAIERIYISRTEIKGYAFALDLRFVDFRAIEINKSEYQDLKPAIVLATSIVDLLDDTQFRIEFDANIDLKDQSKKDVKIDGGLQFDIANKFGYGEVTIVDPKDYRHNIKADMKSPAEILFAYNDTLKGKFSSQTLVDLKDIVVDIVQNPDDHFLELFSELINKTASSPIGLALSGDYGALFEYDIISNLQIRYDGISFDLSLDFAGLSDSDMHIDIAYSYDEESEISTLEGISISGLNIDGTVIDLNARLEKFDDSLESTRLDPSDKYLDFSDLKVLVQLGINTSKFNYYHFTTDIKLDFKLGSLLDIVVPADIKIRNENGYVKVAVELDIPYKLGLNPNPDYYSPSNRHVSLYYEDGTIYIHRTENVKTALLFGKSKTYELIEVLDVDYFTDNIVQILLSDVISLDKKWTNAINKSDLVSGESVIAYEKILTGFNYNKSGSFFEFNIDLNELTNMTIFKETSLKIYEKDDVLSGLSLKTGISIALIINIDISMDLTFENDRSVDVFIENENGELVQKPGTTLDKLEAFVSAHKGDTRNVKTVNLY